jgi:hypothetical protein
MSVIGGLALIPALAFADVDIYVTINKDKNIYIDENLKVEKKVDIDVEVELKTKKAAESNTLVNQKNEDNVDINFKTGSTSVGSVGGSGIVNANQASGNMNNQANAVSVAVDPSGQNDHHNNHHDRDRFDPNSAFAHSQAASDQKNNDNKAINVKAGSSSILNVTGSGIINANQASGSMNNQANAVSVAVGVGSAAGVALSEADLGQVNSYNVAISAFYSSTASMSVTGTGITNVNQSSGHMNNQANVVSVAAVN